MTQVTSMNGAPKKKIEMTRNQRFCILAILFGVALYTLLGGIRYGQFLLSGAVIPDKKTLGTTQGPLEQAKRYGGKTKRRNLMVKLKSHSQSFVYPNKAGDVDLVEEKLNRVAGDVALRYDPESADVYEIERGGVMIRAYEESAVHYAQSVSSQAHLRGILAVTMFFCTLVFMGVLIRRVPLKV